MTKSTIPSDLIELLDDDSAQLLRSALIACTLDETPTPAEIRDDTFTDADFDDAAITDLINIAHELITNADHRETLTDIALSLSLCPLHLIDYAICFDDDDADCAAIRMIHPSHDS